MLAVDQWRTIEASLGDEWGAARLSFRPEDPDSLPAAAGVLAPLGGGRARGELLFRVARRGGGATTLSNLLGHLDDKRIRGTLALLDATGEPVEAQETAPKAVPTGLARAWDDAQATQPPGWRDLLCELELDSSDYLAPAALHGAPLNPTRNPEAIALRFRVSGGRGYGTASQMVRRCLERMDAEGITGRVVVLHALSGA